VPIRTVTANHITSTLLITLSTGFNSSQPSGPNPLIIVLANNTLRTGHPRTIPTFTVSLSNPQTLTHNFAIYNGLIGQGGVRVDRTSNVISPSSPTTSETFTLARGVYQYYCEFHFTTMLGQIRAINPDVDGDGDVDLDDLIGVFVHQFGTDLTYDIDLDGDVDLDDLIMVFLHQFI